MKPVVKPDHRSAFLFAGHAPKPDRQVRNLALCYLELRDKLATERARGVARLTGMLARIDAVLYDESGSSDG